jgi:hypothetical protein
MLLLGENSCNKQMDWSAGAGFVSIVVRHRLVREFLTKKHEEIRRHGIELLSGFKYGLEQLYWWLTPH